MARQYDIGRGLFLQETGATEYELGFGWFVNESALAALTGDLAQTFADCAILADGALVAVTPPVTDAPSGGWSNRIYDPYFRRRKPKKDESDEPTAEEREAAALAIERAVADHWNEQLGQLERRIATELRREHLAIRSAQQAKFRAALEAERTRQLRQDATVGRLEASVANEQAQAAAQALDAARRRRNTAIAMWLIQQD